MNRPETTGEPDIEQFLNMLSGSIRWKGDTIPNIVGTAKLAQAVTVGLSRTPCMGEASAP